MSCTKGYNDALDDVLYLLKEGTDTTLVEEFKDIIGFEGLYQISNLGKVKSLERISADGRNIGTKMLRPNLYRTGYFYVRLSNLDSTFRTVTVHRLVADNFISNPENKPVVNHKDGNKQNNKVSNLEFCTASENIRHAVSMGLMGKSSKRLGFEVAMQIRQQYPNKSVRALTKEYGKSISAIYDILSGKAYSPSQESKREEEQ
jgi:hypothetical protein